MLRRGPVPERSRVRAPGPVLWCSTRCGQGGQARGPFGFRCEGGKAVHHRGSGRTPDTALSHPSQGGGALPATALSSATAKVRGKSKRLGSVPRLTNHQTSDFEQVTEELCVSPALCKVVAGGWVTQEGAPGVGTLSAVWL